MRRARFSSIFGNLFVVCAYINMIDIDSISEKELKEFVAWYSNRFDCNVTSETLFVISMSGHFHLNEKQGRKLLRRCRSLNVIKARQGVVTLLLDNCKGIKEKTPQRPYFGIFGDVVRRAPGTHPS